jgi:hypothetical protein
VLQYLNFGKTLACAFVNIEPCSAIPQVYYNPHLCFCINIEPCLQYLRLGATLTCVYEYLVFGIISNLVHCTAVSFVFVIILTPVHQYLRLGTRYTLHSPLCEVCSLV